VIAAGVDFVQIREKDLPDRQLFDLSARCVALAQGTDCKVLVNGRADIALAAGAHGVHLPSRGLRPGDLGRCLPDGFLVGVSVHSIREARQAQHEGADYVLLGPIFPTPSKLALGRPLGLSYLRLACRSVQLPILALGGMRLELFEETLAAGAAGVAGISFFQKSLGRLEGMRKIPGNPRNPRIQESKE
jgi:thiamine-phosphate pyrophosphorylase